MKKIIKKIFREMLLDDRRDTYKIVKSISESSSRPKEDVLKQLWRRAYDKSYDH